MMKTATGLSKLHDDEERSRWEFAVGRLANVLIHTPNRRLSAYSSPLHKLLVYEMA